MSYPINEIFYSLQGEGYWSGRPAVFVRFSGCNLRCPFCDTDHSRSVRLTASEIVEAVSQHPSDFVVLTGGEPSLFVDNALTDALHQAGKFLAIETNGTRPICGNVDWVTLSPKDAFVNNAEVVIEKADELKLVFDGTNAGVFSRYSFFPARHFFLQPCDTGNASHNRGILQAAVQFCLQHPQWRLSLQMHKLLNIR